jgi:hypothetical protein
MDISSVVVNSSAMEQDQQHLSEILARQEFEVYRQQGQGVFTELVEKLLEWLKDLFPGISVTGKSVHIVTLALAITVTALFLFLVYWFSKHIVKERKLDQELFLRGKEKTKSYADYLQKAKELGQKGEWREGIRYAFFSLLLFLDIKDKIRVEKWKTNMEYAVELQESSLVWKEPFRRLALLFERSWYGRSVVEGKDFDRYLDEIEKRVGEEETGGPVA